MLDNGYYFYFKDGTDLLTFPITPGELNINLGSKNKVVTLINEGDVNILKSPSLIEVSFEARFPMRKYPYSREVSNFQWYFDKFRDLKENKKSFRFIVARLNNNGTETWGTNIQVALESLDFKESADQGDDVLISFRLKQFKEYGVQTIKLKESTPTTTSTAKTETEAKRSEESSPTQTTGKTHTVKSGDTLWAIAKKYYGDGSKYNKIYEANKTVIEKAAKDHGKSSSSNGSLIWAGTVLTIPDL